MTRQDLNELLELERKLFSKLTETLGISQDLADAIDRQDSVSVNMLLSMRQRPILELQETSSYIDLKRLDLSPSSAERFVALTSGSPANSPEEQPVADQISSNRRLLVRLVELDRRINTKLCGDASYYNQK